MQSSIWKKIIKTSALYLFGTVIAKLVAFLMLPIYTDKIPTEAYGTYDIVVAYAAIIVPLIGVNCWSGMLRFTVEEDNEEKKHQIVSQGWLMLIVSLIVLCILYGFFCAFVDFECKGLIFAYFICQMIQYFYIYTARGFNRNKVYAISGIISSIAVAVTSIICIYVFDQTLESLYYSLIVSLIAQVVFIELNIHLLRDISIKALKIDYIKKLYKFCFPESIGTIFNWLLNSVNRVIIVAVLGYSVNGIYAISNKFLSVLNIFMTAFILSFQETIYSAGTDKIENVGNEVIKTFVGIVGYAVSIILLGTSIIYPFFVNGEYKEGYNLIPLFYLYFLMSGITWILSSIVSATKKTKIVLYEKMIIGGINFLIIFISINYIGLYSAPTSLLIAETIGIIVFCLLLKRIAGVRILIPIKKLIVDFLMVGVCCVLFLVNNTILNIIGILVAGILFCVRYNKQIVIFLRTLKRRKS